MTNPRRHLPSTPSSDYLRKQAKTRLAALKIRAPSTRLAEVQHLIAREYGFASWTELQAEVARRRESPAGRYREVRRHPLAVPGRREEEDESQILSHSLSASAAITILSVVAVAGCLIFLSGQS